MTHRALSDEAVDIAGGTKPRRIAPDQGFSGGHDGTRTRDLYRVMVAL